MLFIFGCVLEMCLFVVGTISGVFGVHSEWYVLAVVKELCLYNNDVSHCVRLQRWSIYL